ncbi:TPA: lamin tail domain-containing protein [Candidatus Poribacteria bacterium]|nr:lamin tail domain-containing protein [Candidatus Poribacteria bacterium]
MKRMTIIISIVLVIAIIGIAFQITQAQRQPRQRPSGFGVIQAVENAWAAIAFEVKVDNATLEKARPYFQKAWDERKKLIKDSAGDFRAIADGMTKVKADLYEKLKTVLTKEQMRKLIEWERSQRQQPRMGGPVVNRPGAEGSPVVINELMASNTRSIRDPQGDYDDWIELHNLSNKEINLSGMYLSDNKNNPRKWAFPENTFIPAGGYLIVWADGNGSARPGLHANFRLSINGEMVILVDKDERGNKILDSVEFGKQEADVAYGRFPDGTGDFRKLTISPGKKNE